MKEEVVYKVTAYITRFRDGKLQLLVFEEQGFEHFGLQVPGGTVEHNEPLLDALQREVKEEAGITELKNIKLLGDHDYTSKKLEREVKRYYYQMEASCLDQFTHIVQSNDEDNGWVYKYHWCDVEEKLTLFHYLGAHLHKIKG